MGIASKSLGAGADRACPSPLGARALGADAGGVLLPHRDPTPEEAFAQTEQGHRDLIESLDRRLKNCARKVQDLERELRQERERREALERELRCRSIGAQNRNSANIGGPAWVIQRSAYSA